jgi:hypothetical protein
MDVLTASSLTPRQELLSYIQGADVIVANRTHVPILYGPPLAGSTCPLARLISSLLTCIRVAATQNFIKFPVCRIKTLIGQKVELTLCVQFGDCIGSNGLALRAKL